MLQCIHRALALANDRRYLAAIHAGEELEQDDLLLGCRELP